MSHGRRRKKVVPEEHENHERWLVSYADMVTLVMCLFIVLFAMSQVDQAKYEALAEGLSEGFGAPSPVLDAGQASKDPGIGLAAPAPVDLRGESSGDGKSDKSPQEIIDEAEQRRKARLRGEAEATFRDLSGVREQIDGALRRAGYPGSAHYKITDRGLVVSIIADQVLFDSARADLRPGGQEILNAVAPALREIDFKLAIEGHTNHLPLRPGSQWPSDWELSASRATAVLRHLETRQVPDTRMFAAGFSDTAPLIDPKNPAAVAGNRRVDIVVLSSGSPESNELLSDVAKEYGATVR